MEQISVALDWTANTNHTGFFVAKHLGYYRDKGLNVNLITPEIDSYTTTPAKRVELGEADFALAPMESVISYRTKPNPTLVKAVAALLQEDLSAIVTLKTSDLSHPALLDGKCYASYKARYEDEIVKQMIINDGGIGDIQLSYPDKLGIWETLMNGKADATWVFMNWEGLEAEARNVPLHAFKMVDFGIPYGYSPILLALESRIKEKESVYQAFLQTTKGGFMYAKAHPEEAAEILKPFVPVGDQERIDLVRSQKMTGAFYGSEGQWGKMETGRVADFLDWLRKHNLETAIENVETLFTNQLLLV